MLVWHSKILVPLMRNCSTLGLFFFGPPFLVGEIVGPLFKAIRSSFSLMMHSSSTIFLSILVVFFSKNSLNQCVLQFCGKQLVVVWLAHTFNLKILKCTIKRKSIYWGCKYNNEAHSCQHLLQIVDPFIRNSTSLGFWFFCPPLLVGKSVGPLSKAIRSSFSLMMHSSAQFFYQFWMYFLFRRIVLSSIFFSFVVNTY